MDWTKGFSAACRMDIVDPETWRDVEEKSIMKGSIDKTEDGLRESADIECRDFETNAEKWIRVWLYARQDGSAAREALFTGIVSSPSREISGTREVTPLECYSVLKPAKDVLLQRGWYAPSGANGAELAKSLLSVTPAPIYITGESRDLQKAIVAEDGESRLSMADKILAAVGMRLRISGMGEIEICEKARESIATFGAGEDVIEPSIKVEKDWFDCPNVFRAIADDVTAVARDDAIDSPLSTVNRGREVWAEETNCEMNDGESVAEYAIRRLRELQQSGEKISYERRFDPRVNVGDLLMLHYPRQGLQGIYMVKSQTIEIGLGARVSEEVASA